MWQSTILFLGIWISVDCRVFYNYPHLQIQLDTPARFARDVPSDINQLLLIRNNNNNRTSIVKPPRFTLRCGTNSIVVKLMSDGFHMIQGAIISVVRYSEVSIQCGKEHVTVKAPEEVDFCAKSTNKLNDQKMPESSGVAAVSTENVKVVDEHINNETTTSLNKKEVTETFTKAYNDTIFESSTKAVPGCIPNSEAINGCSSEVLPDTTVITESFTKSSTEALPEITPITGVSTESSTEAPSETLTKITASDKNDTKDSLTTGSTGETEVVNNNITSETILNKSVKNYSDSLINNESETKEEISLFPETSSMTNIQDSSSMTGSFEEISNVTTISNYEQFFSSSSFNGTYTNTTNISAHFPEEYLEKINASTSEISQTERTTITTNNFESLYNNITEANISSDSTILPLFFLTTNQNIEITTEYPQYMPLPVKENFTSDNNVTIYDSKIDNNTNGLQSLTSNSDVTTPESLLLTEISKEFSTFVNNFETTLVPVNLEQNFTIPDNKETVSYDSIIDNNINGLQNLTYVSNVTTLESLLTEISKEPSTFFNNFEPTVVPINIEQNFTSPLENVFESHDMEPKNIISQNFSETLSLEQNHTTTLQSESAPMNSEINLTSTLQNSSEPLYLGKNVTTETENFNSTTSKINVYPLAE